MKPPRRQFFRLAAGAAALPFVSRMTRAQSYPTHPVRLVIGFPPGGQADIVARLLGQSLSQRLGQPFVIENKPGAGTNIAIESVVRSAPDGYSLLFVTSSAAINATLYEKLTYSFIRDIAPVASIARGTLVMVVNPSFPANTVPEFIAYAKANPGKLNMASGGIGSGEHVTGELFKMTTSVNMVHVPYRGSAPALTDLLSGQVQVYFSPMASAIEHIRAGKMRALAVTTATRSEALPTTPTVGDFVPGFEASSFNGIAAPKNTPAEIIERLNKEINAALADPTIKARLTDLGSTALPGSPADFGKLIADETEKWAKVVKFAGLKPE
jgi:tripartite-type tricarboxylate transporter receptor subunit TctC